MSTLWHIAVDVFALIGFFVVAMTTFVILEDAYLRRKYKIGHDAATPTSTSRHHG